MSTTTPQPQVPPSSFGTKAAPAYEFPKRKRWADLLFAELVDDIVFVLSPDSKVLYCGISITELLGWKDIDLLDLDFFDLIDPADQPRFRTAFEQAIRNGVEVNLATKLKAAPSAHQHSDTSPKDLMFDIKFYPHVSTENEVETKCIFAMASPYPSRNTAMLNTIMDLKAENSRLQQKVTEYRNRIPAELASSSQSPPSQAGSMYATSSLNPPRNPPVSVTSLQKAADLPGSYLAPLSKPFDGTTASNSTDKIDLSKAAPYGSNLNNTDDQGEDGSKKKKLKRAQNAEQYVCITCGRTDSPEWRKGPLGPKTLCNACGLRWAKQMRKVDEPAGGTAAPAAVSES